MTDVWGQAFADHLEGHAEEVLVERDDGVEHALGDVGFYFQAPRTEGERELLERLRGPVLDLGAGAGAYTLFLQSLGLEVTAADVSPAAVEVCRRRGCLHTRIMDLRAPELQPASFRSVIIMGNTLGAHQTPETLGDLLAALHAGVGPGGRLLCATIDPLETDEERHLAYHRRNRERGLPPGLARIRMKYKGTVEAWMPLWMPTDEEMGAEASGAGWRLLEERREGPHRLRLFEAT